MATIAKQNSSGLKSSINQMRNSIKMYMNESFQSANTFQSDNSVDENKRTKCIIYSTYLIVHLINFFFSTFVTYLLITLQFLNEHLIYFIVISITYPFFIYAISVSLGILGYCISSKSQFSTFEDDDSEITSSHLDSEHHQKANKDTKRSGQSNEKKSKNRAIITNKSEPLTTNLESISYRDEAPFASLFSLTKYVLFPIIHCILLIYSVFCFNLVTQCFSHALSNTSVRLVRAYLVARLLISTIYLLLFLYFKFIMRSIRDDGKYDIDDEFIKQAEREIKEANQISGVIAPNDQLIKLNKMFNKQILFKEEHDDSSSEGDQKIGTSKYNSTGTIKMLKSEMNAKEFEETRSKVRHMYSLKKVNEDPCDASDSHSSKNQVKSSNEQQARISEAFNECINQLNLSTNMEVASGADGSQISSAIKKINIIKITEANMSSEKDSD